MTPEQIIETLGLEPHPEGGHFGEIYSAPSADGDRAAITSIYFLLREGERSHWHRLDASELWYWHAGAPLVLSVSADGKKVTRHLLGCDLELGQRPQVIVPPGAWQAAESQGHWTLVGCAVAPGFEFEHFEMAPEGWVPGSAL